MDLKILSRQIKSLTHEQFRKLLVLSDMKELLDDVDYIKKKQRLEDVMKEELWEVAKNKFTLVELEEKLGGNRFTL